MTKCQRHRFFGEVSEEKDTPGQWAVFCQALIASANFGTSTSKQTPLGQTAHWNEQKNQQHVQQPPAAVPACALKGLSAGFGYMAFAGLPAKLR